jgi:uroporphyrinogen-III synthase
LHADIYPANDAFFMKPLISAMATALGKKTPRRTTS